MAAEQWYLFGGVLVTPARGVFSSGSVSKVATTGEFSSLAAAQAYARATWGGSTTYKVLGIGDSLPSELEDIFAGATHSEVVINGPYATQADAEQALDTGIAGAGTSTATSSGTDTQGPSLGSWEQALTTLAGDVGQRNFWLRVAKGAVGILLIAIGIYQLSGAGKAVKAVAKTAL